MQHNKEENNENQQKQIKIKELKGVSRGEKSYTLELRNSLFSYLTHIGYSF